VLLSTKKELEKKIQKSKIQEDSVSLISMSKNK